MAIRDESTRFNAAWACEQLEPWAVGDFDGHSETTNDLGREATEIVETIAEKEGDARTTYTQLEMEVASLVAQLAGALRVARDAIDLASSLGAGERRVVFERLRQDYRPH